MRNLLFDVRGWIAVALAAAVLMVGSEWYHARQFRVVFDEPSQFNGRVIVRQSGEGLLVMQHSLDETVFQTVMDPREPLRLYSPYSRLAFAGLGMTGGASVHKVLLVGLGGGATPAFIREALPGVTVDVVDIDPVVVRAARQYFGFLSDDVVRLHVVDGLEFVQEAQGAGYGFVLLDAYSGSDVPRHLRTVGFLQAVRRTLAPGGVVVSNIMGPAMNPHYDEMLETLAFVFPDGVIVADVPGRTSRVVYALTAHLSSSVGELAALSERTASGYGFPADVGRLPGDGVAMFEAGASGVAPLVN
jgi:spermidine synthase